MQNKFISKILALLLAAGLVLGMASMIFAADIDITADFTDPNFLAAVRANLNKASSDPIYANDVSSVTTLDISNKNISSLAGIKHFTGLRTLNCSANRLTTLDVSGLTALQTLSCYSNQLTSLNVDGLSALKTLDCRFNRLTTLNMYGLTALQALDCSANLLTMLDVSGLTALQALLCSSNKLTMLYANGLKELQTLLCYSNQLTTLNVDGLTSLQALLCSSNQLTTLNVDGLTALRTLDCSANQLTTLDISKLAMLQTLVCSSNQLTTLDLSGLSALQTLDCSYNQLTGLDVSKLSALRELGCHQNRITGLDVTGLDNLTAVNCKYNYIEKQSDVKGYTGNITFGPQHTPRFRATTDIAGVYAQTSVGVPLVLTGKVVPSDADNQNIVWNIANVGTTGAAISDSTFTATSSGTARVQAAITNGEAVGVDYAKNFYITVNDIYNVIVNGGKSSKTAAEESEIVTITADIAPKGQQFKEWTASSSITFKNPLLAVTTFRMPANEVTVTANFEATAEIADSSSISPFAIAIAVLIAIVVILIIVRKK